MTKTVSAAEARGKLDEILDEVRERGGQYIIEREGQPVAAVVPVEEFQQWLRGREEFFALIDKIHEHNKDVDPEELERDIEAAIRETREAR